MLYESMEPGDIELMAAAALSKRREDEAAAKRRAEELAAAANVGRLSAKALLARTQAELEVTYAIVQRSGMPPDSRLKERTYYGGGMAYRNEGKPKWHDGWRLAVPPELRKDRSWYYPAPVLLRLKPGMFRRDKGPQLSFNPGVPDEYGLAPLEWFQTNTTTPWVRLGLGGIRYGLAALRLQARDKRFR